MTDKALQVRKNLMRIARVDGLTWEDRLHIGEAIAMLTRAPVGWMTQSKTLAPMSMATPEQAILYGWQPVYL